MADRSKMSRVELEAALEAATAKLAKQSTVTLKVTDKGGLSVYGLGRWPVTLYRSQWERMLDKAEDIRAILPTLPIKTAGEAVVETAPTA